MVSFQFLQGEHLLHRSRSRRLSDRTTQADNKIYGVSNFRCMGTFTRTRFWIK